MADRSLFAYFFLQLHVFNNRPILRGAIVNEFISEKLPKISILYFLLIKQRELDLIT